MYCRFKPVKFLCISESGLGRDSDAGIDAAIKDAKEGVKATGEAIYIYERVGVVRPVETPVEYVPEKSVDELQQELALNAASRAKTIQEATLSALHHQLRQDIEHPLPQRD